MTRLIAVFLTVLLSSCALIGSESQRIPGATKTISGLQYIDSVVGSGASPVAGNRVTVHYTGTLKNGKKFDSSRDRSRPFSFNIGRGEVILGWEEGVMGMKVGGRRQLFIPPELAYGERGIPGVIPPWSDLIFDVELLEVLP